MKFASLSLVLLALALSACSQAEAPVPAFQTVVIDFREPGARVAGYSSTMPLPERRPANVASAPAQSPEAVVVATAPVEQDIVSPTPLGPDGRPVASSTTVASSEHVTRYLRKLLPDFNQITDCPNGITCRTGFAY